MPRFTIAWGVLVALSFHQAARAQTQTPTIALKAVKINPTCVGGANAGAPCVRECDCDSGTCGGAITPTDSVVVLAGATVVVEAFASEWSPNGERLQAWGVSLDVATLASGDQGELHILEGQLCCSDDTTCRVIGSVGTCIDGVCNSQAPCSADADCAPVFYDACVDGFCGGGASLRAVGMFIDTSRTDYVFFEGTGVSFIDLIGVRFGGLLIFGGLVYTPPPRYLATMVLVASEDAVGTFTVRAVDDPLDTTLIGVLGEDIPPPTLSPLSITVVQPGCGNGLCEPGENTATCFADCADDSVPTVSQWGMIVAALSLLTAGKLCFPRRRRPA